MTKLSKIEIDHSVEKYFLEEEAKLRREEIKEFIKELKLMTSERIQSWHLHADGQYHFNQVKNSRKLHDLLLTKLS